MGRFDERVYLVTGGTRGLGASIAAHLAEEGAAGVVINGRDAARAAGVTETIASFGATPVFVEGDLGDPAVCRRIASAADESFGRIDGLVNAAGLTDRGTIDDTSVELWDRLFAVNARAPFLLAQECVRRMRRDGRGGAIVNVISMSAHGGQPFLVPYSASKGALANLTKNLAHGLRKDRIRVNGINLGWTDTPAEHDIQVRTGAAADWLAKAEAAQPFGRLIKPSDVAALVTYLLSDDATMMTGALIDFDQNVMGAYD